MGRKKSSEKIRVTLDLTPEFYGRLESLERVAGASTKASVIRDALQVYEYIVERTLEGCQFQLTRKNGEPEKLVFLGVPGAR